MNELQLNQNMTTDCHFIYAYQIVKKQYDIQSAIRHVFWDILYAPYKKENKQNWLEDLCSPRQKIKTRYV